VRVREALIVSDVYFWTCEKSPLDMLTKVGQALDRSAEKASSALRHVVCSVRDRAEAAEKGHGGVLPPRGLGSTRKRSTTMSELNTSAVRTQDRPTDTTTAVQPADFS
jgi:hypothetical protein